MSSVNLAYPDGRLAEMYACQGTSVHMASPSDYDFFALRQTNLAPWMPPDPGVVYLKELGLNNIECNEYCPSDYDDFRLLIDSIDIDAGRDVFLDFGAGIGRVIVLAARHPFKRVIGVELSEQLSAVAKQNIKKAKPSLRCSNVEIVTCDATLYEVPDEATVVYFYNPFIGEALETVLINIRHSLTLKSRPITLICNHPSRCAFDAQIRRHGWLNLQRDIKLKNGRRGLIFLSELDGLDCSKSI